ncbi:quinol:cytochrome C oxidoreductase [Salibacter sp.]|uniref:quinol:cytochrome C oxidoreductase n=1 Tax=Salibacter sp. TaxID=2010995 RepID=UPI00286FC3E2|nr:quinol:cytochrome C oxidoreductase [Salibacter sp.]MDR9486888.1 quinol:cytochrome C oxidoreductase [Salibacter sp.]
MDQFTFTDKSKKLFIGLIAVGVIATLYGIFSGQGARTWTSAMISGWFFFGIALAAVFFIGVNNAAQAAWGVVLKRVFEGVSMFMPYGTLLLLIVFLGATFHWNHIYHWMDQTLYDPSSSHYDDIIAGKEAYLNLPFWWIRAILLLGVWNLFTFLFRKRSLVEDQEGKTSKWFKKNLTLAAIFLVFFGYTIHIGSWDWIMSVDTHWFSTLFGWYIFSGIWVSGIVMVLLITIFLKKNGYLKEVNDSHIHDMGKWVFAISFLWTYLWFSQFMLIWYSDIPEEVTYFLVRLEDYGLTFWGMVLINFIFPMILLMSKDMKRNAGVLTFVGVIILFGHWMDSYFLFTPGVMKDQGVIGLVEIGMMLGYLGLFLFVVFNQLTKAPLVVKKHAFLEESLHHHIN